ncbi:MAG: hypothetical protein RIB43_09710 [Rhodospirillaceae bacterium]
MRSAETLRPWGQLKWLWPKLPKLRWKFVGCVGTEDRTLSAWQFFTAHTGTVDGGFFRIEDLPSRYSEKAKDITNNKVSDLLLIGKPADGIENLELLCSTEDILGRLESIITKCDGNVILDISCFPKRFFFPILRRLFHSDKIHNLLVCCGVPLAYGDDLSEDPTPWDALPTYGQLSYPDKVIETVFLGVGYLPLGFSEVFKTELKNLKVYPFLPVPPFSNRNWQFVNSIQSDIGEGALEEPIRVDSRNVSEAFDYLVARSQNGASPSLVAPFGPKTLSLAMALFSLCSGAPAYYTQPKVYSPNYSSGVALEDGAPSIWTYAIKINGQKVYRLPT